MDIRALGFYDVDELYGCCKGMLAQSCERNGIDPYGVEGLLAERHLSTIMGNIGDDDAWHAMEDFVEFLQQEVGDSIPLERQPTALAASIVDNMVRQAIADISLTSEDFSKRIFEAVEVDDYCPDLTVGHPELLTESGQAVGQPYQSKERVVRRRF